MPRRIVVDEGQPPPVVIDSYDYRVDWLPHIRRTAAYLHELRRQPVVFVMDLPFGIKAGFRADRDQVEVATIGRDDVPDGVWMSAGAKMGKTADTPPRAGWIWAPGYSGLASWLERYRAGVNEVVVRMDADDELGRLVAYLRRKPSLCESVTRVTVAYSAIPVRLRRMIRHATPGGARMFAPEEDLT